MGCPEDPALRSSLPLPGSQAGPRGGGWPLGGVVAADTTNPDRNGEQLLIQSLNRRLEFGVGPSAFMPAPAAKMSSRVCL